MIIEESRGTMKDDLSQERPDTGWFCCSAVRLGRVDPELLSQREGTTPERFFKKCCAQAFSRVSEMSGADGNNGNNGNNGSVAGKSAEASAQQLSKVSEWVMKNGKRGIGKCRTDVQNVDMVYAQRLSKVSEWVVKQTISKMYSLCLCVSVVKNDQAQRLSKVSELVVKQTISKMYSLCLCVSVVKNDQAQRLSKVSEWVMKNEKRYAQRVSNTSKILERLKGRRFCQNWQREAFLTKKPYTVVLKQSPESRRCFATQVQN